MENTHIILSKLSNKEMTDSDWSDLISLITNGCIELSFLFEEKKNKACVGCITLLEFDGERSCYLEGLRECLISAEFKKYLQDHSFFSPIVINTSYCLKTEQIETDVPCIHQTVVDESNSGLISLMKKLDINTIPVVAEKIAWGLYRLTFLKNPEPTLKTVSLCKAGMLCLAISIMSNASADDKLNFESESGIDKIAKKMNDSIKENYRINPALQQEMNQDPNFDKSRVVNYKRAGNQAINDYIRNDTDLYPALKSLEDRIQNFFNGDNALENRERLKTEGTIPSNITEGLKPEDAESIKTQLRTQVLKGQARFRIITSIGEITTEVRAFGGEVFRASARTKALELKEFGIQVQGTVDYTNSQINSAIRTRINPNTSFHLENVRNVASEGKADNRVRLNYDIDF